MLDRGERRFAYDEPDWLARLSVRDARLRRLAAYWDSLRKGRSMPRFDELEPWKVPDLLPIMWVWRVDRERRLMHLRLVGDEVAEAAPATVLDMLRRRYEQVAYGPAILQVDGIARLGEAKVPAERLILPLGSGDEAADDILGISHYDLEPQRSPQGGAYAAEESREILLPLREIR